MIRRHRLILTVILGFSILFNVVPQTANYRVVQLNGKNYYVYTVQPAEGFYAVSKRFNVSQEDIMAANPEVTDGLKLGQEIRIPIKNATVPGKQSKTAGHTVAPGETLYSVSKAYGISVDDMLKLNPEIENNIIKTGSTLKVPQGSAENGNTSDGYIYHIIREGETMYSVGKNYNLTVEEVQEMNPGLSPANFTVGKVIRLDAKKAKAKEEKEKNADSTFPYVLESKEKLEDIAKKFNVSTDELKKVNPDLPKNLSPGDKILIPSVKPQKPQVPEVPVVSPEPKTQSDNPVPQIAVLLPFMVNGTANTKAAEGKDKMLEYYEGFLMALNDAKAAGFSADVYVYDTNASDDAVKKILGKDEMKKMNLIIGPAYDEQVSVVSDFSATNNIPMVVPFTSKNAGYQTNPNIFLINAPQSYLYSEVNKAFIREFKNYNIIILNTGTADDDKTDFISSLTSALKEEGISCKNVTISATSVTGLEAALSESKSNIILPAFNSSASLNKYMPNILNLREKKSSSIIKLFGYPDWQNYGKSVRTRYLHPMDTYIFSGFYAELSSKVTSFRSDFMKAYSKDIKPNFPKFALLGYDTGRYFLNAIQKYGYDFQSNISSFHQSGLQMDFHFERVNHLSGFINKGIYFIHFGTDSNVNATNYR